MNETYSKNLETNLFTFEECNPILFPLIFKMQRLSGEAIDDYQLFEQVRLFDKKGQVSQIDLFKDRQFSHQELTTFYQAQLEFIQDKRNGDILNDNFVHLCDYLENPLHHFLMKHDHEDKIKDGELLSEFPDLVNEINRDNIITDSEKELLIEKAKDIGLSTDKIEHLQNEKFIGFNTFRILVDQVCEDGVITDKEHSFILEKAEQYNVPDPIVEKLLKKGLAKAKILKEKSFDEEFYQYVISYFILNFVERTIGKNIKVDNLTNNLFDIDSIKKSSFKNLNLDVLNALEEYLSKYLNTDIELNNIYVFLRNLGLQVLDLQEAISKYKKTIEERSLEDLKDKYKPSTKEFKGFLYQIECKKLNSKSLFTYSVKGDEIIIYLNTNHPLVGKEERELEIIEFFLISMISTKLEYPNNDSISHFWKLFHLYQQHLTLSNY